MSITISDIETGLAAVDGFRNGWIQSKAAQKRENKAFSANKRDKLYRTIQAAYVIAAELMKPGNEAVLDELLAQHGLKRDKRKGSNPWVATVNLLFGTWVDQNGAKARAFKPDRSAWKYAASFRFFHEHGWPADEIAKRLAGHTTNVLGKSQFGDGLIATQKEDAYDHRKNDADVREDNDLLKRFVAHALSAAEISKGNVLNNDGVERRFVALWGIVIDGKVHVYGELPNRSAGVRAHATKVARGLDHYMNGQHKKEPRSPKLLPPNVINSKGRLVRKEGMTIVDIEEVFAADAVEIEGKAARAKPKATAKKPRATIEVPLPRKTARRANAVAA